MNIYTVSLDASYGAGLAVVSAETVKQANQLVDDFLIEKSSALFRADNAKQIPNAIYNGEAKIIDFEGYAE